MQEDASLVLKGKPNAKHAPGLWYTELSDTPKRHLLQPFAKGLDSIHKKLTGKREVQIPHYNACDPIPISQFGCGPIDLFQQIMELDDYK